VAAFDEPVSDYNLVGDGTGCPNDVGANDVTVDPTQVTSTVLEPLADNGGTTLTHALLPGSPAIDGADDAVCTDPATVDSVDQRGQTRVGRGLACDIGSIEDDPLAVYYFNEGSGALVHDTSGAGTPIDLTIANPSAVDWVPGGGLHVHSNTIIQSGDVPTRLIQALKASNEFTIDVLIEPDEAEQQGPARIVTISQDTMNRNVMLGHGRNAGTKSDQFVGRLRTTGFPADMNGVNNALYTLDSDNVAEERLMHVIYTYDGTESRIYVDGVLVASRSVDGDFSNWDEGYSLALGNEVTMNRKWKGTFYRFAIYDRAINP
jgi:hypothetical protein